MIMLLATANVAILGANLIMIIVRFWAGKNTNVGVIFICVAVGPSGLYYGWLADGIKWFSSESKTCVCIRDVGVFEL